MTQWEDGWRILWTWHTFIDMNDTLYHAVFEWEMHPSAVTFQSIQTFISPIYMGENTPQIYIERGTRARFCIEKDTEYTVVRVAIRPDFRAPVWCLAQTQAGHSSVLFFAVALNRPKNKPALESLLGRGSIASNAVRSLVKQMIGCQINIWYIIG